jgi:hypothetical protein
VAKILLLFWRLLMSLFGVITEYFENWARFLHSDGKKGRMVVLAGPLDRAGLFSWTQVIIAAQ